MQKKNYILYILMRNDLPSMNVGRAAAQASHASNAFIHAYGKRKDVKEWQKQTNQGFGTAIILSANIQTICDTIKYLDSSSLSDWVTDPEYGMIVTKEIYGLIPKAIQEKDPIFKEDGTVVFFRRVNTCAYIFGDKENLFNLIGSLPLFPETKI